MTAAQLGLDVPERPSERPSDRCRMCHRELTDPTSRALGIGPECLTKLPGPPGRVVGEWPPGPDDPVLPLDAVHRLALLALSAGVPALDVADAAGLPVEEVRALAGEPP